MTLADFTTPGLIIAHLQAHDVESVLRQLSGAMQREGRVPKDSSLYEAALKREILVSTDMAVGMAFPHARLSGLKQLSFALARTDQPFSWSSKSTRPVQLIFLLAVPEIDAMQSLQLISGISRFASQPQRVAEIYAAKDAEGIWEVLREIPLWSKPVAGAATVKS